MRTILHVDMDAFYASVEQRDDETLVGKPVIVGGNGPRGVVAAASYEVRQFGVRSAMPVREALRRCPQAICVRPRMQVYRHESRRIFDIFREFTPIVQGLSLDEAFLDMTASMQLHRDALEVGRAIKDKIRATTGLTASVGSGPNKLIAKIASDLDKPDGLTHVPAERIQQVLDPLPARAIPGLGPKAAERLAKLGIHTIGELRQAPASRLNAVLGRYGVLVKQRAAGRDDRPVIERAQEQSISVEETFDADIGDPRRLESLLIPMSDRVAAQLRNKHYVSELVTVKIRSAAFRTATRQRLCRPASDDSRQIARIATELLAEWLAENPEVPVRLLGVGCGRLRVPKQLDMFGVADGSDTLDTAVDEIHDRFGNASLRRGSSLRKR